MNKVILNLLLAQFLAYSPYLKGTSEFIIEFKDGTYLPIVLEEEKITFRAIDKETMEIVDINWDEIIRLYRQNEKDILGKAPSQLTPAGAMITDAPTDINLIGENFILETQKENNVEKTHEDTAIQFQE